MQSVDIIATNSIDSSLYGKVASKTELNSIEQQLVDGIDPAHIREYLHKYSSKPHIAGSQADYETALYTVDQFESFGIKTEIKEYYTLLSTPVRRRLAILEPAEAAQELNLTEASVTGDACTADPTAEPPFLAYSPSGNVTAPVVYVNYGTQQDFQWAVDQGIELKGKIALVRYGENYRGLKVLAALEHGMAGVLIYSDPLDDGFGKGPVYPEGPWRPENSFQRGSIYNECGDPLTPGWASLLGAKYLKYEDVTTIPHLPTLPLSYGQAKYILKALRGKQAPASWQGGLTFPDGGYHIGDDSSTVLNLDLEMDNSIGPIWDVIGTIEGSEEPDKQVILGNHRDAWVCGAIDPNSGTSVLVELGRVFGNMLKQGWKPKRTIVLASWDAEEQGLLGSTEYVEDNAELLKEQAIAYLNVDGTLGPLADAGGSPSIAKLLFQTANAIPANAFGGKAVEEKTLYEQWLSQTEAYRQRNATSGTIGPDHLISVLGTGSDFGGFCHHLGIVSANVGFTFPGNYGTYHSTMDSIMYSELFADPDYVSHVTTARWWGLLALRLADNDVLPLEFSTYALVMDEAVTSFEEALKVAAERYPGVDEVNFAELRRAIDAFDANTKTFHTRLSTVGPDTSSAELSYWNDKLMYLERHLTLDAGLPHRGWYKHVVFGPGFYDGYGGTAFPGLADGIAFHDSADAIQAHVDDVVGVYTCTAPRTCGHYEIHSTAHKFVAELGSMMSPFPPKTKSRGPVLTNPKEDDEIYGTFQGRQRHNTIAATSVNDPNTNYKLGGLLRVVGVAGLVLLAAGYVAHLNSSSTVAVDTQESLEAAINNEVAVKVPLTGLHQHFVENVDAGNIREYLHKYSSVPHSAGTHQDYKTAVYTAEQFESFGIEAEIKEYYTLLSTPVRRHLAIVEPAEAARELNLTEAVAPSDACTSDDSALPPFVAYAATGNVTNSIVFVNFGKQADFEWLVANNVTLEDKIALVRYGGNFRGLKVMAAEQHGMAGVLIYSDPKEDGFVQGPVYPDGPWRPEGSFQRGSLQYLSLAGGDPMTPGWASVEGSYHLPYEDVKTIPHIPALPLSYGQAQYILKSLGGREAPAEWQGGLSLPNGYRIGDDEATVVNLDIEIDNKVGPIWDVIGRIEGTEEPDELVIMGNHRDAWVCGAIDPNSGSSVLLEIARGYGELLKQGWKPRRTLILGSWDGEEYGLLGSTEYAEDNAEVFKKHAVAYLNVDGTLGPLVSASASPAIAQFLYETAKAVPASKFHGTETEESLYEQWTKQTVVRREHLHDARDGTLGPEHLISFMGSGSDFTAFYQHLGIISADLGFKLSYGAYGTYHSSMDSIMYSELYADPLYATHVATAQWWGLLALRLADDKVLPFDFSTYGFVMKEDLAGLEQQVAELPRPGVDFSELHVAIARFTSNANAFHAQLSAFAANETLSANADTLHAWNEKLVLLERHLITKEGLPHRPWYKHVIFGPGFYEGYAGAAFPGISDAIAFYDDTDTIQEHVDEVARIVSKAANYLLFSFEPVKVWSAGYAGVNSNSRDLDLSSELAATEDVAVAVTSTTMTDVEKAFVHGIDVDNIRDFQHRFSSPQDFETAKYTAQQFEKYGFQTEIKTYHTLLSTPVRRHLAIVEPSEAARELNLTEPVIPKDSCTSDDDALPPFLAYAATGNVTASVVYVNFGKPEDFEWLVANNVTLKGKIALARYGGNYRGLKVMSAEAHGMVGALIYSDPNEDGFVQGPVYPDGPWRPEDSFQRGATIFLSLATGDPLTPGFASVPGAPYLKYEDAKTIPHIPALPLSYGQAKYILASLGGMEAPATWQGGLTFPNGYRVGDDETTVLNLDIEMDNKISPIWDVIGSIEGSVEPDQQVLLGNHRDAWVCGAIDPSSGSSVLMEIARGLGELLAKGWRPRRTIVLGSWDGEEPGLLGSTEYAEDNAEVLKRQAVAYLNVDMTVGPLVSAGSSPSIAAFLFNTAKDIPANQFYGNETEKTLYEQWVKQNEARRAQLNGASDGTLGPDHLIKLLGSGSDYSAFYQHLGITSVDMGFTISSHAQYGVYHSAMDSIMFLEQFGDPNYATHATTARWWGLLGLRLADNAILPFDYTTYAIVMNEDLTFLEAEITGVEFSALHEAITHFSVSADAFHSKLVVFASNTSAVSDENALGAWNEKLVFLERHLISEAGLPHRPWYKHVIFGPGFYEGYAGAAFPGISDCVAFKDNSTTIQAHVDDVTRIVNDAAAFLHKE
ncbi:hypothetical protein JM16_002433 [Phytophthora kernoviae]|uniref:Glutamate carboxypeptidase n=1 Tax=Phytophthora kernoviae TaxID=325452 RepID=A0A8T0M3N7_9STRA|nr:hypothetical protein JM16_002433 [Phytophthora kernoviae]